MRIRHAPVYRPGSTGLARIGVTDRGNAPGVAGAMAVKRPIAVQHPDIVNLGGKAACLIWRRDAAAVGPAAGAAPAIVAAAPAAADACEARFIAALR